MNRNRLALWAILVVIIVGNMWVIWVRTRSRHEPLPGKEQLQAEQILSWESSPVLPLDSPSQELRKTFEGLPNNSCTKTPGGTIVSLGSMPPKQKDALYNTLSDLVRCYSEANPDSVIAYMKGIGEEFDPLIMNLVKDEKLRDRLITKDELAATSDEAFFGKVWEWQKCNPAWQSLLKEDGYICIQRYHNIKDARSAPLGRPLNGTFRNITSFAHLFRPRISMEDASNRHNGIMVAEAMIVIQHDSTHNLERSPYFFRFWYSEEDSNWHPFDLKRVSANYGTPGSEIQILF